MDQTVALDQAIPLLTPGGLLKWRGVGQRGGGFLEPKVHTFVDPKPPNGAPPCGMDFRASADRLHILVCSPPHLTWGLHQWTRGVPVMHRCSAEALCLWGV